MKLLLDECVVHDLKQDLAEHEVATATEAGFGGLTNGELLRAASTDYDVLITVDRNLPYQQNIRSLQLGVLVIRAGGVTYDHLKPLVPRILQALEAVKPGKVIEIE
jgi:predicted nuclease of predicted toxin-antitoxin system